MGLDKFSYNPHPIVNLGETALNVRITYTIFIEKTIAVTLIAVLYRLIRYESFRFRFQLRNIRMGQKKSSNYECILYVTSYFNGKKYWTFMRKQCRRPE